MNTIMHLSQWLSKHKIILHNQLPWLISFVYFSSPVYDTPTLPTYSRPVPKNLRNNFQENAQTATIENLGKGQTGANYQKLRKQESCKESTAGPEQPTIQQEVHKI